MKTVDQMYGKSFFGKRFKLSWRAPHVIDAIEKTFGINPEDYIRYIDVGCAIGDLVNEAYNRGYDAWGIEGSKEAEPFLECDKKRVLFMDLRKIIHVPTKFHVLSCFEVAEHIEEDYADMFVRNLCALSSNLIISAAPPGQKGHHHYNCQPFEYWDEKFARRDYVKMKDHEERFRSYLAPWKHKDGIRAFYHNCLVYRRYHGIV